MIFFKKYDIVTRFLRSYLMNIQKNDLLVENELNVIEHDFSFQEMVTNFAQKYNFDEMVVNNCIAEVLKRVQCETSDIENINTEIIHTAVREWWISQQTFYSKYLQNSNNFQDKFHAEIYSRLIENR